MVRGEKETRVFAKVEIFSALILCLAAILKKQVKGKEVQRKKRKKNTPRKKEKKNKRLKKKIQNSLHPLSPCASCIRCSFELDPRHFRPAT